MAMMLVGAAGRAAPTWSGAPRNRTWITDDRLSGRSALSYVKTTYRIVEFVATRDGGPGITRTTWRSDPIGVADATGSVPRQSREKK